MLATLLCCDAWFDVVLDAHTKGFWLSLLSALLIELPLAALAILGARRLLRMTNAVMLRYRGLTGPMPRLRDIPLVGMQPGRPLSDLLVEPEVHLHDGGDKFSGSEADSGRRPLTGLRLTGRIRAPLESGQPASWLVRDRRSDGGPIVVHAGT